jgi:hypothetical protein
LSELTPERHLAPVLKTCGTHVWRDFGDFAWGSLKGQVWTVPQKVTWVSPYYRKWFMDLHVYKDWSYPASNTWTWWSDGMFINSTDTLGGYIYQIQSVGRTP